MTQVLGIVKEGKLIPEDLWQKFIKGMENDFEGLETNSERAKRELSKAIIQAIKKRIDMRGSRREMHASSRAREQVSLAMPMPRFGILFSGGVDSSLIAFVAKKLE